MPVVFFKNHDVTFPQQNEMQSVSVNQIDMDKLKVQVLDQIDQAQKQLVQEDVSYHIILNFRQTDRQTDRQTHRHTDTQATMETSIGLETSII